MAHEPWIRARRHEIVRPPGEEGEIKEGSKLTTAGESAPTAEPSTSAAPPVAAAAGAGVQTHVAGAAGATPPGAEIETMSVVTLHELITASGLGYTDCVGEEQLRQRAREAQAHLQHAQYHAQMHHAQYAQMQHAQYHAQMQHAQYAQMQHAQYHAQMQQGPPGSQPGVPPTS